MKQRKTLKEDFTTDYTAAFLPAVHATADNANSVEEYLGTLMQSVVETWGLHLNTNKYSEHIALNEFYDEMIDLVDTLIENYKGIYGNIPTKPYVFQPEATNASEYLRELAKFVENGRNLFSEPELLSDIDSILSAIDECMYKVENLTENRKRNRKMMKESINLNEEQIIEITDEMKEEYPSLKNYDKIIISGKKMNFDEAEEYAKENNAILPNIEEGNDIVKFVVEGRKHISFEVWTQEEANNAENAVYRVSTNGTAYTSDNNKDNPFAKFKVFCLCSNKMNESKRLSNKRLNERKVKNTDKLNKLNSLIKEGIEGADKQPYWFSNPALKLMADKLIRRFGNEKDFEDFYYKAFEYANGYISETELADFALCDAEEMDDDDTYYKTIDEFIAAVWDIKDEDFHLTESMKKAKKKLMKESKELRLIDSIEVDEPNFSEIGYFGKANWYDAMDFSENNSEGWRLPSIKEGKEMVKKYVEDMKRICKCEYFWAWTNKEGETKKDGKKIYAYYVSPVTSSFSNRKEDDQNFMVFLIR